MQANTYFHLHSDFLLILMKDLLGKRRDIRLILMSASFNTELFVSYFNGCPHLHVSGFTYDVQEFYLEDALRVTGFTQKIVGNDQAAAAAVSVLDE